MDPGGEAFKEASIEVLLQAFVASMGVMHAPTRFNQTFGYCSEPNCWVYVPNLSRMENKFDQYLVE